MCIGYMHEFPHFGTVLAIPGHWGGAAWGARPRSRCTPINPGAVVPIARWAALSISGVSVLTCKCARALATAPASPYAP